MNQEECVTIDHLGGVFKCYRGGRVFRVKPSGENQTGTTPHKTLGNKYYYRTSVKGIQVHIHRLIAKAFLLLDMDDRSRVVDHIDGNGLNNSVDNLRVVTQAENQRNRQNVNGISKKGNSYRAKIHYNGEYYSKSSKDVNVVIAWRREKEIEFGFLTRAACIVPNQQ